MIKEIAFSVYAVTDIPRAREFFEGKLGLVPSTEIAEGETPQWIEYGIGSGTLAIGCSPEWKPSEDGAVVALEVDDFDEYVAGLKEKGVPFKMDAQEFPSCKMAVILDPDKNSVLIHQIKSK
jgi:predicted enzyme related to lactoylglutathione lyase